MDNKVLKFDIIGCGVAANFHVRAINNFEDAELYGVYDKNEVNAKRIASEQGSKYAAACCNGTLSFMLTTSERLQRIISSFQTFITVLKVLWKAGGTARLIRQINN